jgi:uncharacterized protein (UPF0333 family)
MRGNVSRGQLSFEFIILFAVVLMMFVALGSIISEGVSKGKQFEKDAQMLADAIKIEVITASLSNVDYYTEIQLPASIRKSVYTVNIYAGNDNLILIKDENQKVVGRAFLPIITSAPSVELTIRETITIKKDNSGITIGMRHAIN